MTRSKLALPLMILGALLARAAGGEPALSGKWKAVYATGASERVEAEVAIEGSAGTWIAQARGSNGAGDPCAGRPLPLSVSAGGSSTLSFFIEGSSAAAGCGDRRARLTVVDSQTLEGEFDDGRVVRLRRR